MIDRSDDDVYVSNWKKIFRLKNLEIFESSEN